jgi:hypothetical protein
MKSPGTKSLLLLIIVLFAIHFNGLAQSITGIWRGYFITDDGERYKLEFQLNNSSNFSQGVSYSYLDVRFYGKASMTGSYSKTGKNLKIREIKTVEVKNLTGSGACIMNYNLVYSRLGREEFLEGSYLGKPEVKIGENPYRWGDCGGGRVFLRRVATSDFYVEPFLKGKIKTIPIIVNQPPQKKIIPPATKPVATNKPPVKTNPPVVVKKPVTKPVAPPVVTKTVKKPTVPLVKTDTAKNIINTQPIVKVKPPVIPKPAVLKSRSNELVKILTVTNPNVVVKLFDNGEIDGDTISVYWDNKLVLSAKGLTAAPLTVKLNLEEDDNAEHSLTMVAENLGRIPPNTSLMVVEAGEQRFDVRITSDNQKNAVVRFRYQKPANKAP